MTSTVPASLTRTAEGSALQAVFLDMDGTLVDTEGFWWDAEVGVFADLGHALDEAWRDVVVGGPMTRSAAYLIEATGADITPRRADRAAQRPLRGPDRARRAPDAGRRAGCSPSWPRTRCPPRWSPPPTARIIDRVLARWAVDNFALTVAGDEVAAHQAAPGPLSAAPRRLRGRPGELRGHRGHGDRCRRRRGGGLPGGGRAVRGADRARRGAPGRTLAGRSGPCFSAHV